MNHIFLLKIKKILAIVALSVLGTAQIVMLPAILAYVIPGYGYGYGYGCGYGYGYSGYGYGYQNHGYGYQGYGYGYGCQPQEALAKAPANLREVRKTYTSLDVAWEPVTQDTADRPLAVHGYDVRVVEVVNETPREVIHTTTTQTNYAIAQLTNGSAVSVYVFAISDLGDKNITASLQVQLPLDHAPVAQVAQNTVVGSGSFVQFNASGSTDADGDTLSFSWTQTGGPRVLTSAYTNTARPMFMFPEVQKDAVLTFQLTVSDGLLSTTRSVSVIASTKLTATPYLINAQNGRNLIVYGIAKRNVQVSIKLNKQFILRPIANRPWWQQYSSFFAVYDTRVLQPGVYQITAQAFDPLTGKISAITLPQPVVISR